LKKSLFFIIFNPGIFSRLLFFISLTNVPAPGCISIASIIDNLCMPSLRAVLLTPKLEINSSSVGSLSPGLIEPSSIFPSI